MTERSFRQKRCAATKPVNQFFISFVFGFRPMLVTIAVLLFILWLLGLITSYTLGGFIHILLIVAIIMVLIRVIRGENPL